MDREDSINDGNNFNKEDNPSDPESELDRYLQEEVMKKVNLDEPDWDVRLARIVMAIGPLDTTGLKFVALMTLRKVESALRERATEKKMTLQDIRNAKFKMSMLYGIFLPCTEASVSPRRAYNLSSDSASNTSRRVVSRDWIRRLAMSMIIPAIGLAYKLSRSTPDC